MPSRVKDLLLLLQSIAYDTLCIRVMLNLLLLLLVCLVRQEDPSIRVRADRVVTAGGGKRLTSMG